MGVQEEIESIVIWYRDLPADFLGINDLMYSRQRLVGFYVEYAVEVGMQRKIWAVSKAIYEKTNMQIRTKHLPQGVGKAETISRANSANELLKEADEEGEYYKMFYCMKAYEQVLSAMNQQIAQLREELNTIKYKNG